MLGSRNHKSMKWKDDEQDEIGMKMSVVGRKMTESITKKGKIMNSIFMMFSMVHNGILSYLVSCWDFACLHQSFFWF
jgi:hypothetical protein